MSLSEFYLFEFHSIVSIVIVLLMVVFSALFHKICNDELMEKSEKWSESVLGSLTRHDACTMANDYSCILRQHNETWWLVGYAPVIAKQTNSFCSTFHPKCHKMKHINDRLNPLIELWLRRGSTMMRLQALAIKTTTRSFMCWKCRWIMQSSV